MTKKLLVLASCFTLLFGLAACSNNDQEGTTTNDSNSDVEDSVADEDNTNADDTDADVVSDDTNQDEDIDKEKEETADKDATEDDTTTADPLADFEEGAAIESEVDLDGLDVQTKVDTNEKRILLFNDGDQKKVYKTIYIKHKNMLKIIDIQNDEGQIFHGTIK